MSARTRTWRPSALWRSIHAVLGAPHSAYGNLRLHGLNMCNNGTLSNGRSARDRLRFRIGRLIIVIVLAVLPSSGCNSEWCVHRQCTHRDLLGYFGVKWPGRRQLKQTRFSRARVLRCSTANDRNFSQFSKLCKPVQWTHFWIDTLLTKERPLFRELSVTVSSVPAKS